MAAPLEIDFAGQVSNIQTRTTFGRAGGIEIDDNPHMHRILGAFEPTGDGWKIVNLGSLTELTILEDNGRRAALPPGSTATLTRASGTVSWRSGRSNYELTFNQPDPPSMSRVELPATGPETAKALPPLTPREIDFMVTFCRHKLLGRISATPTYSQVAIIWGVKAKTVDNTLQNLRAKMSEAGFVDIASVDEIGAVLIDIGYITLTDLQHGDLDNHDGPRTSRDRT